MANEAESYEALDLTTAILLEMDRKGIDPVLGYAALGCAFIQLHKALGHSKEAWLSTTREMTKGTWGNE